MVAIAEIRFGLFVSDQNKLESWEKSESARIYKETAIERELWVPALRFPTLSEARTAIRTGILVSVPHLGDNYLLNRDLRDDQGGQPTLLRPEALDFLNGILASWKQILSARYANHYAAVTSLFRDEALQAQLKGGGRGYNAVGANESSHASGGAFDISARSYLVRSPDGSFKGVQSWDQSSRSFDNEPMQRLYNVLVMRSRQGLCNFVVENVFNNGIVQPSVYHVSINPKRAKINR